MQIKDTATSSDQNAGQNVNMGIHSSSLEGVEQFKYLGTTLTHQNSIQDWIKSGLKSGNACYYSVLNLLSSILLPKNLKMNLLATDFFFQILAHPVFKMWVIQKPYKVALWNKTAFWREKNGDYTACLKYSVRIFVE